MTNVTPELLEVMVASKDVRKYLEDINFQFTDRQKASLIYHTISEIPYLMKSKLLRDITSKTDDTYLKNEIDIELTYEDKMYNKFQLNNDRSIFYVYILNDDYKYDIERGLNPPINSYFMDFKDAYNSCIKSNEEFLIYRVKSNEEIDNVGGEYIEECHRYKYNNKGEMIEGYYHIDDDVYDSLDEFVPFTDNFIDIPVPFKFGDIVRNIYNNTYGVIVTHNCNDYLERAGMFIDFTNLNVYTEDISNDVSHIISAPNRNNPLLLEYYDDNNDSKWKLLNSLSEFRCGEIFTWMFEDECNSYIQSINNK